MTRAVSLMAQVYRKLSLALSFLFLFQVKADHFVDFTYTRVVI